METSLSLSRAAVQGYRPSSVAADVAFPDDEESANDVYTVYRHTVACSSRTCLLCVFQVFIMSTI